MEPTLKQRLAQGEAIDLKKEPGGQEVCLDKDIGAVRVWTRANMQMPGGLTIPDAEIPLGTLVYGDGAWAWTSPVGATQTLSPNTSLQVGRSTLHSDNRTISAEHYSLIVTAEDTLVIRDEDSTNGTWVAKLDR